MLIENDVGEECNETDRSNKQENQDQSLVPGNGGAVKVRD